MISASRITPVLICLVAATAMGTTSARAQGEQAAAAPPTDPNGTLTFQLENDVFAATDRYYTNGFQFSWLSPTTPPTVFDPVTSLGRFFLRDDSQVRWGLAFGQTIYTPEDTDRRVPDPGDRPYAGWLFGAVSLVSYSEDELNTIELQMGVVGPSALGEQVQNTFHDIIRDTHSEGWDHQLKDEFGVNLIFDRKWRAETLLSTDFDLAIDATPSMTVSLGNVSTYAGAGLMLRFGQNLKSDFGAPRIRPALAGAGFYDKRDGFGWYVFGGVEGRVVLRDIFLDGNTWRDNSPSVDRKWFVGDLQAGASVFLGATRLTYSYVIRSEEFEGQNGNSKFGSISASWSF